MEIPSGVSLHGDFPNDELKLVSVRIDMCRDQLKADWTFIVNEQPVLK